MIASHAYGLIAHALIFAALCASLPLGVLRARMGLIATVFALFVGIAPAMHGFMGAPSLTLSAIAVRSLAASEGFAPIHWQRRYLTLFLIFAAVFYFFALGLGLYITNFDLYAFGFSPGVLLLALVPFGLFLYFQNAVFALVVLSLDLLAWRFGLFGNLWDALFCAPLVLFCCFKLIVPKTL